MKNQENITEYQYVMKPAERHPCAATFGAIDQISPIKSVEIKKMESKTSSKKSHIFYKLALPALISITLSACGGSTDNGPHVEKDSTGQDSSTAQNPGAGEKYKCSIVFDEQRMSDRGISLPTILSGYHLEPFGGFETCKERRNGQVVKSESGYSQLVVTIAPEIISKTTEDVIVSRLADDQYGYEAKATLNMIRGTLNETELNSIGETLNARIPKDTQVPIYQIRHILDSRADIFTFIDDSEKLAFVDINFEGKDNFKVSFKSKDFQYLSKSGERFNLGKAPIILYTDSPSETEILARIEIWHPSTGKFTQLKQVDTVELAAKLWSIHRSDKYFPIKKLLSLISRELIPLNALLPGGKLSPFMTYLEDRWNERLSGFISNEAFLAFKVFQKISPLKVQKHSDLYSKIRVYFMGDTSTLMEVVKIIDIDQLTEEEIQLQISAAELFYELNYNVLDTWITAGKLLKKFHEHKIENIRKSIKLAQVLLNINYSYNKSDTLDKAVDIIIKQPNLNNSDISRIPEVIKWLADPYNGPGFSRSKSLESAISLTLIKGLSDSEINQFKEFYKFLTDPYKGAGLSRSKAFDKVNEFESNGVLKKVNITLFKSTYTLLNDPYSGAGLNRSTALAETENLLNWADYNTEKYKLLKDTLTWLKDPYNGVGLYKDDLLKESKRYLLKLNLTEAQLVSLKSAYKRHSMGSSRKEALKKAEQEVLP